MPSSSANLQWFASKKIKISAAQMAAMEDEFRRNGWNLECGPCDDTTKQPSAGVGAATRGDHVQMIPTSMYTDDFKEACESGRGKKHTIDLGWEDHVIIYCMYGAVEVPRKQ